MGCGDAASGSMTSDAVDGSITVGSDGDNLLPPRRRRQQEGGSGSGLPGSRSGLNVFFIFENQYLISVHNDS
jgi:hypothetical protein